MKEECVNTYRKMLADSLDLMPALKPYKLPLTPHVPFFPPPGAASVEAALLARITALEAELREARDWAAELEAEVLATRARGPFLPVTLGCL